MSSIDDSKTEAQKAQELRNERARQEADRRRLDRQATRSGDTGDQARQQLSQQNETEVTGRLLERIMPQIRSEIAAGLAKAKQEIADAAEAANTSTVEESERAKQAIAAEIAKATQISLDGIAEKVLSRIQLNSGAGIACSGAGGSWTVSLASDIKSRPTTVTATCNDDGTITITAS